MCEDRTLGTLPENVFLKMAKKYTEEQSQLDSKLLELQKVVDSDNSHEMNVNSFLEMIRKYTAVHELTPEILRHFIDKIVVHHRTETKLSKSQRVDFYFNFIGQVEIPEIDQPKPYLKSFGRKKENHTAIAV